MNLEVSLSKKREIPNKHNQRHQNLISHLISEGKQIPILQFMDT